MSNAETVVTQRQGTHGEYADSAPVMQAIKRAIRSGVGYEALPDIMKESLDLFAHKIGRIVTGNPYVLDHWLDISGYSLLIQQRVEEGGGIKPEYQRSQGRGNRVEVAVKMDDDFKNMLEDISQKLTAGCEPMVPRRASHTPEDGGHHETQNSDISSDGGHRTESVHLNITDEDIGRTFRTYGGEDIIIGRNLNGDFFLYPYISSNPRKRYSSDGKVHPWDGDGGYPNKWDIRIKVI